MKLEKYLPFLRINKTQKFDDSHAIWSLENKNRCLHLSVIVLTKPSGTAGPTVALRKLDVYLT